MYMQRRRHVLNTCCLRRNTTRSAKFTGKTWGGCSCSGNESSRRCQIRMLDITASAEVCNKFECRKFQTFQNPQQDPTLETNAHEQAAYALKQRVCAHGLQNLSLSDSPIVNHPSPWPAAPSSRAAGEAPARRTHASSRACWVANKSLLHTVLRTIICMHIHVFMSLIIHVHMYVYTLMYTHTHTDQKLLHHILRHTNYAPLVCS
jgi:hypothetical protein